MVPFVHDYQGNLVKPTLNYEINFDSEKKGPIHTLKVEYGKVVGVKEQVLDGEFIDMRRVMQHKKEKTIQKFPRDQCQRTALHQQQV